MAIFQCQADGRTLHHHLINSQETRWLNKVRSQKKKRYDTSYDGLRAQFIVGVSTLYSALALSSIPVIRLQQIPSCRCPLLAHLLTVSTAPSENNITDPASQQPCSQVRNLSNSFCRAPLELGDSSLVCGSLLPCCAPSFLAKVASRLRLCVSVFPQPTSSSCTCPSPCVTAPVSTSRMMLEHIQHVRSFSATISPTTKRHQTPVPSDSLRSHPARCLFRHPLRSVDWGFARNSESTLSRPSITFHQQSPLSGQHNYTRHTVPKKHCNTTHQLDNASPHDHSLNAPRTTAHNTHNKPHNRERGGTRDELRDAETHGGAVSPRPKENDHRHISPSRR